VVRNQPRQIVRETPIRKKPFIKKGGGVSQGLGPEFKPQYRREKKERKERTLFYHLPSLCKSEHKNLFLK
jgi:hypothetical protein